MSLEHREHNDRQAALAIKLRQAADELERGFTQQKKVTATAALDADKCSAASHGPASAPPSPHDHFVVVYL